MTPPSRRLTGLALAALAFSPTLARATPDADATAARAEARFRDGSDAFDHGRVDEACAAFAESASLYPTLSTLLNLALCHERQGKSASAWLEFTHAAAWAEDGALRDRREFAHQHARKLEGSLAHVELEIAGDATVLDLRIDGEPVVGARRSLPVFLDPGPHTLRASAPSRLAYTTTFTVPVSASAAPPVVHVPLLQPVPSAPSVAGPPAAAAGGEARLAGWILGGVGLASVGVGVALGVDALKTTHALSTGCNGPCNPAPAETAEAASLAAFGAGLAALATGTWLVLRQPSSPASVGRVQLGPQVSLRSGGVLLRGEF